MKPKHLLRAVEDWNDDVENNGGVDSECGRKVITHFGEGPYYAIKCTAYRQGTCGGICVNANAQVESALGGGVVPRLYAAGNCCSIGAPGLVYPGPGGSVGPGMVFAYIAAKDACALPDWE